MQEREQERRGWVVAPVATIHRQPQTTSEVVTSARMGEGFHILVDVATEEGQPSPGARWWKVRLDYDGYEGYLSSSQGREVGASTAATWLFAPARAELPVGVARNLWVQAYAEPVVQAPVLATLSLGVPVRIVNSVPPRCEGQEPWYEVQLPNDRLEQAFIQQGDVNPGGSAAEWAWRSLPQLRASLVATARRFLGVPYRWGGTSSLGIDCSGFVQLLYRLHGLFLPRDADQQAQYEQLDPIERDQLVPGDLLFFNRYGHVGMAISHHEFIHATTHGQPMVQISEVDEEHWAQARCDVRRYRCDQPVVGSGGTNG